MTLHHLILSQASMGVSFHGLAAGLAHVFDKAQVKRAPTILVSLELGDGSF